MPVKESFVPDTDEVLVEHLVSDDDISTTSPFLPPGEVSSSSSLLVKGDERVVPSSPGGELSISSVIKIVVEGEKEEFEDCLEELPFPPIPAEYPPQLREYVSEEKHRLFVQQVFEKLQQEKRIEHQWIKGVLLVYILLSLVMCVGFSATLSPIIICLFFGGWVGFLIFMRWLARGVVRKVEDFAKELGETMFATSGVNYTLSHEQLLFDYVWWRWEITIPEGQQGDEDVKGEVREENERLKEENKRLKEENDRLGEKLVSFGE